MIVYLDGRYLDRDEACISPDDRGFVLGDGVYEVIRFYGGRPFALAEHLDRLARSIGEIRIEGVDAAALGSVARRLVEENGLGDAVVYIQVTRGAAERVHRFPGGGARPTVWGSAAPFDGYREERKHGAAVVTLPDIRWGRCDIKTTSLLPNVLASEEATRRGAIEAILVRDGVVTEGASSTLCAVDGNRLLTHPEGPRILSSVTRSIVLRLCGELGVEVVEKAVAAGSLAGMDEALLLSTTKEILPVVQVDGLPVSGGVPGPVTRRLQEAFTALTRGGGN
ncbi:MAG: aminotransferase class IV [Candidatus Krumholzibacteriota bacterium]|nr:aminotransferase class IV [Candidatus Krumholzibacteriota bacterium]